MKKLFSILGTLVASLFARGETNHNFDLSINVADRSELRIVSISDSEIIFRNTDFYFVTRLPERYGENDLVQIKKVAEFFEGLSLHEETNEIYLMDFNNHIITLPIDEIRSAPPNVGGT